MSQQNQQGKLVQLTGLWKGSDKNGNVTLTGSLGGARLLVFKNNYKKDEKHPDYIVYLAEKQKEQERAPAIEEEAPF